MILIKFGIQIKSNVTLSYKDILILHTNDNIMKFNHSKISKFIE